MSRKLTVTALMFVGLILSCAVALAQSASAGSANTGAAPGKVVATGAQRPGSPDVLATPVQEGFEQGDFNISAFRSAAPTCVPGGCGWFLTGSPHTGSYSAQAPEQNNVSDQQMILWNAVSVPASPASATLSFWHKYSFEAPNYDGGVFEFSTDGGTVWTDVLSSTTFVSGGYTGIVNGTFHNPLSNRQAWIGTNGGSYTQVVIDLMPFAGQNLLFRFRMGTDDCCTGNVSGWNVDDVVVTVTDSQPCPPSTPGWGLKAPMPMALADQAVVAHRGYLYSFGGYTGMNSTSPVTNSFRYDPRTDTWMAIAGLPSARGGIRAVSNGVYIFLVGGRDAANAYTRTMWRYDTLTNTYSVYPISNSPTADHSLAYVSGFIYRVGGDSTSGYWEWFNLSNNSWTTNGYPYYSYPAGNASGLSAITYQSAVYGAGGNNYSNVFVNYSPNQSSQWIANGDLLGARYGSASGVLNGRWILAGGIVGGGASDTVVAANAPYSTWIRQSSMLLPRSYVGGGTVGQAFYAVGGYDNAGNPTNTNQQYLEQSCTPYTPVPTNTPTSTPISANAFAHLEPNGPQTITVGSKVNFDLMVNAGTNTITAAQNYLTFTNSVLQAVNPLQSGCVLSNTVTQDSSTFDAELQNEVCNTSAPCDFGRIIAPGASIAFASGTLSHAPAQGEFRVAQVAFCATATGDARIHWQFAPPAPSSRDTNVTSVGNAVVSSPSLYSDYILHVVPVLLVGHVDWEGRLAQPNARQQLPITITLKMGAAEVDYASQTTDASGYFTVSVASLTPGTYDWRVKGPTYLARSGSIALAGAATTSLEIGQMRAGDANNDNVVNSADFSILRNTFGKTVGDAGYDGRADFNGDSVVSSMDFGLLRGNFGVAGPGPLSP